MRMENIQGVETSPMLDMSWEFDRKCRKDPPPKQVLGLWRAVEKKVAKETQKREESSFLYHIVDKRMRIFKEKRKLRRQASKEKKLLKCALLRMGDLDIGKDKVEIGYKGDRISEEVKEAFTAAMDRTFPPEQQAAYRQRSLESWALLHQRIKEHLEKTGQEELPEDPEGMPEVVNRVIICKDGIRHEGSRCCMGTGGPEDNEGWLLSRAEKKLKLLAMWADKDRTLDFGGEQQGDLRED